MVGSPVPGGASLGFFAGAPLDRFVGLDVVSARTFLDCLQPVRDSRLGVMPGCAPLPSDMGKGLRLFDGVFILVVWVCPVVSGPIVWRYDVRWMCGFGANRVCSEADRVAFGR